MQTPLRILERNKQWRLNNPDKVHAIRQRRRLKPNFKEHERIRGIAYRASHKEQIKLRRRLHNLLYRAEYNAYHRGWRQANKVSRTLVYIKQRCNNPHNHSYKYYGGRGIKCLITKAELQLLWKRDKGWLLKKPSIDRINSDKHYTFKNCRFIEHLDNSIGPHLKVI